MRVRVWSMLMAVVAATALVGCGGDNLDFCDGCGTPTPTVTVTPTPTPTESSGASATPTPSPSNTPTGPFGT